MLPLLFLQSFTLSCPITGKVPRTNWCSEWREGLGDWLCYFLPRFYPRIYRSVIISTQKIVKMNAASIVLFALQHLEMLCFAGPKLYKEPSFKSNKFIIHNAITRCCLAGKVNEPQKNKIVEVNHPAVSESNKKLHPNQVM